MAAYVVVTTMSADGFNGATPDVKMFRTVQDAIAYGEVQNVRLNTNVRSRPAMRQPTANRTQRTGMDKVEKYADFIWDKVYAEYQREYKVKVSHPQYRFMGMRDALVTMGEFPNGARLPDSAIVKFLQKNHMKAGYDNESASFWVKVTDEAIKHWEDGGKVEKGLGRTLRLVTGFEEEFPSRE